MRGHSRVSNNPASTHKVTPADLERKRRDNFVNHHLHIAQHDRNVNTCLRGRKILGKFEKNKRTPLSFFSFSASASACLSSSPS